MVAKRIVLHFPRRQVEKPIIYRLVKDYDLEVNILKASISPDEEGLMALELKGNQENFDKGVNYLKSTGLIVDALSQSVLRNESRCTQCGACISVCPVGAFELDLKTRKVRFLDKKCIVCGLCIKGCPPRAMEVHF